MSLTETSLHLFPTTSLAVLMATVAKSIPKFGRVAVLILLPLQIASGGMTPRKCIPAFVQYSMLIAPTTHFVSLSQAILFRGAGLDAVWSQPLALATIGAVFFFVAKTRFQNSISESV